MRNFAILGARVQPTQAVGGVIDTVVMDDVPVRCAIVETDEPVFDRNDAANDRNVLVRVRAFSLNYRDKNRIFMTTRSGFETSFYVVGSEFVGEVLDAGPGVTRVAAGDRVIGDCAYPSSGVEGVGAGVPTNHASKEIQIFHEAKLAKIPDSMPDDVAAAFSIGGQTTYSMIRRLEIFEGANVLVTAAKSNTSLFAINALRDRKTNLYVTSSSNRFEDELKSMGVKEIAVIDHATPFVGHPAVARAMERGGIHFVIDPYWDLHFSRAVEVMAIGGKYISCGVYDQYLAVIGKPPPQVYRTGREFISMMLKNLHVLGNCIGLCSDLAQAIDDYHAGKLDVVIDSTYSHGQEGAFLDRTYNAKDRFGKVVYQYS